MSMRIKAVLVSFFAISMPAVLRPAPFAKKVCLSEVSVLSLTCSILLRFDRLAARACRQDRRTMLV